MISVTSSIYSCSGNDAKKANRDFRSANQPVAGVSSNANIKSVAAVSDKSNAAGSGQADCLASFAAKVQVLNLVNGSANVGSPVQFSVEASGCSNSYRVFRAASQTDRKSFSADIPAVFAVAYPASAQNITEKFTVQALD